MIEFKTPNPGRFKRKPEQEQKTLGGALYGFAQGVCIGLAFIGICMFLGSAIGKYFYWLFS